MRTLVPGHAGPPGTPAGKPARLATGRGGTLTREGCASLLRAAGAARWPGANRPWRLRLGLDGDTIELYAGPSRALRRADPSGRVVHIASGAALFNLRLAIAVAGREPVTRLLPRGHEPRLLAVTRLAHPHRPGEGERAMHAAIGRHVGGGPFTSVSIPAAMLGELKEAAAVEGAVLDVLDPPAAARVLFRAGHAVLLRGMPGPRLTQLPWAWLEDRSRLAVLSTPTRAPAGWLRTGQALQRVLLLAGIHGVAAAPLMPALEPPDHRMADYLHVLGIEQPQLILRLSGTAGLAPRR
jgi:hypothetical protein